MLVIAYDMVAIPVYLAFSQPPGHIIEEHPFIGALIRFFWSFECFMSFNTAYYNSMAILVEDRTKCVIHHLRTSERNLGPRGVVCWYRQILDGSFSAVSRPMFASKYLLVTRCCAKEERQRGSDGGEKT